MICRCALTLDGPTSGVVAGDHVAAAVAHEVQAFLERPRRAGGFDHDVDAFAVGEGAQSSRRSAGVVASRSNTWSAPMRRRGRDATAARRSRDGRRAAEARERDGAQADGAGALHEHGVARPQRGALEDVHRRQQAAAAADVVVERDGVGQARDADARLEIDRLRPAAEQPLGGRIGDARRRAARSSASACGGRCRPGSGRRCGARRRTPRGRLRGACDRRGPSSGPRIAASVPAETCPGMIGYGTPARRPCQRWTSVPHTSARAVRSSAPCGEDRAVGTRGSRSAGAARASPRPGCGHPRRMRYSVDVRSRISFLVALMLCAGALASRRRPTRRRASRASTSSPSATTGSTPSRCTSPSIRCRICSAAEVASVQREAYEYRTRDERR